MQVGNLPRIAQLYNLMINQCPRVAFTCMAGVGANGTDFRIVPTVKAMTRHSNQLTIIENALVTSKRNCLLHEWSRLAQFGQLQHRVYITFVKLPDANFVS
jgi:hypothetical protein